MRIINSVRVALIRLELWSQSCEILVCFFSLKISVFSMSWLQCPFCKIFTEFKTSYLKWLNIKYDKPHIIRIFTSTRYRITQDDWYSNFLDSLYWCCLFLCESRLAHQSQEQTVSPLYTHQLGYRARTVLSSVSVSVWVSFWTET